MLTLSLPQSPAPCKILCLGAHCDDIEIGCGGTILRWVAERPGSEFYWVVFSSDGERRKEALRSSRAFLQDVRRQKVRVERFRNGFFPYVATEIKEYFEDLKNRFSPDVIFTHYREDRHQDHRVISDLTWNTFRRHLILEYEILKYDGDLGQPNLFVPLDERTCTRKIQNLLRIFESQTDKHWFTADGLESILRVRGVEAGTRYAEAFYSRKIVL